MAADAAVQNRFAPDAFSHNRIFKTKDKKVVGCHDLHTLLQAQSRGLVVAAVKKLPGDNLPEGVYTALVTCRPDVDRPNSDKQQGIAPYDGKVWEMVRCTNCDCIEQSGAQGKTTKCPSKYQDSARGKKDKRKGKDHSTAKGQNKECQRNGILFKFEPYVKTIYDPNLWPDERLKNFCLRAYNDADASGRSRTAGGVTYWEGKVIEKAKEYWMGGFLENGKIKNFFFTHPEDRELKNVA